MWEKLGTYFLTSLKTFAWPILGAIQPHHKVISNLPFSVITQNGCHCLPTGRSGDNGTQITKNKVAPDKKTFRWKTEGKAHVSKDSNPRSMLGGSFILGDSHKAGLETVYF